MRYLFLCLPLLLSVNLFAQENNALNCADGIDNDNDGLIDCDDPDCDELPNLGCSICPNGLSFADTVLFFDQNCGNQVGELDNTLGVANWSEDSMSLDQTVLSLGKGGTLRLGFTNNQLSNSGSTAIDLWVFEVGFAAERSSIALKPVDGTTRAALIAAGLPDLDGDGYFTVGVIEGSTTGFDIDAVLPGFPDGTLLFDAIQLRDDQGSDCSGPTTGADIDAVCALSSMPPVDCRGVPYGTAKLDACGECLEPNDPDFNKSCADCAGVPNGQSVIDSCGTCLLASSREFNAACTDCTGTLFGTSVIDGCGLCLEPDDPLFNQTCFDCQGVPGGPSRIDSCGVCLLPTDPEFNQSCADCAGTPNGLAIRDSCRVCLIPTDSTFNQSCADRRPLFVPTAFSPNGDGNNDVFGVYKPSDVWAQVQYCRIYDRWGGLQLEVGPVRGEFSSDRIELWDGGDAAPGIYAYVLEVRYQRGRRRTLKGTITLLR
ncbi:MAG: gliding motility-associated C-terminal domain-containing protein [Bacteroidota bacterium]